MASAKVLEKDIDQKLLTDPHADIILLGDFNTEYWQPFFEQLKGQGNEQKMQESNDGKLFYNLWYDLPESKRYETGFAGKYHTLSHILINTNLYDNNGFQYQDNSFLVPGQPDSDPQSPLINADGTPFRWQLVQYLPKQMEKTIQDKINKIVKSRKCSREKDKRCNPLYIEYSGIGFSDHLPLIAGFFPVGLTTNIAKTKFNPSSTTNDFKQPKYTDTIVEECPSFEKFKNQYLNATSINLLDMKNFKKCIFFEDTKGAPLSTFGFYKSNYIETNGVKLGISLARSFDPRPVKDGVPIGNVKNMDNLSDMCFTRKVLQGDGGKINLIYGRLGYLNGIPSIMATRRSHIVLSDLPFKKKIACKSSSDDN